MWNDPFPVAKGVRLSAHLPPYDGRKEVRGRGGEIDSVGTRAFREEEWKRRNTQCLFRVSVSNVACVSARVCLFPDL